MKIKSLTMAIIIFIVIFGGIGVTKGIDLWSTKTNKIPAKIKEGEFEGSYNPADIRGSYTFQEVANLFDIELSILYEAFRIPTDTKGTNFKVKELEALYEDTGVEIGTASLRIFVALYKNLPITLDSSYLTKEATELILQNNTKLTNEQQTYLEQQAIDLTETGQLNLSNEEAVKEETSEEKSENSEESENIINGYATFQVALEEGITKEQIEEIIGKPMPPTNQKIKDYCVEAGLTFSEIKNQLNNLIEK